MRALLAIVVVPLACGQPAPAPVEEPSAAACTLASADGVACTLQRGGCLQGRAQGPGEAQCSDGSRYVGEFTGGAFHGQGTRTWPDGANYRGAWQRGLWSGQGTWTDSDGAEQRGLWLEGRFYSPKICK